MTLTLQQGDRVVYTGENPSIISICMGKELQVLGFPTPATALVKAETWKIDHEIPLQNLKFVRRPEVQIPQVNGLLQKGDRCISEVSGNQGEVTKANSRFVYVHWDRDKNMGLSPIQYSFSDLEIMRIVSLK